MFTNPLPLRFLKEEDHALHQNVTVYVGIYVSLNDPQLSITLTLPPPTVSWLQARNSYLTRVLLCTLHTI